jgi:integrase/recombinase XerC
VDALAPLEPPSEVTRSASADAFALLLADKRSPATRKAYRQSLVHFFGHTPTPEEVKAFAGLPRPQIALRLNAYKSGLLAHGCSEATVNLRLAALRSLLKLCHRLGYSETDGSGLVDGEKARAYRDTRGIGLPAMRALVAAPGTDTLKGLRDTALLRLLLENGLRRSEVVAANVGDFSLADRRLLILGKGRGTQKEPITLTEAATRAISDYLGAAGHGQDLEAALFLNLSHRPDVTGGRLTGDGLFFLVREYGEQIGVANLTPHKLRHSAITAALDATNGDVRRVQRLSRHAQVQTLLRYDDNRQDLQGGVTRLLSGLLNAEG